MVPTSWEDLVIAFFNGLLEILEFISNNIVRVVYFVRESPILLLTTGFLVLGGAIGIFGRLLSKN